MILTLNIPQTGVTTQATTGTGFDFGLSTSARASKASKDVVLSGRPLGIFAGVAAFMVTGRTFASTMCRQQRSIK
jgi:hypothetical protein